MTRRDYGAPLIIDLSDCEKAYIAGIVEGEGHIGMRFEPPDFRTRDVSPRIRAVLEIEMAEEDLIVWLSQKLWGKTILSQEEEPKA